MRRTIETSALQSIMATGETCWLYFAPEASEKRVNIPRTSLAIYDAINMAFPNELAGRKREALRHISNVAPVLISANEAADIGISARLKLQDGANSLTRDQIKGLKCLEKKTFDWLRQTISSFKDIYGPSSRESEVVDALTHDFITLSEQRRKFPVEDYREYVELDSLIYVLGCITLATPAVPERCDFDFRQKCAGVDELRRKYSAFITGEERTKGNDKVLIPRGDELAVLTIAQIMSLQGAEMILKIRDDIEGRRIDKILGIPNLCEYAESKAKDDKSPHGILDEMRKEYLFLAETGGLPALAVQSAEIICHLTSVGKAKVAGSKSLPNMMEGGTFMVSSTTTTLRHELEAAGVLESLFCRA